nr:MAG TPA: hypothetical protein [Caudoviricetes sp.]
MSVILTVKRRYSFYNRLFLFINTFSISSCDSAAA